MPQASPTIRSGKSHTLQGRFLVSYDHIIGEGSFATVCKGLDRVSGKEVAVKVYKALPGDEDWDMSFQNFKDTIDTMQSLAQSRFKGEASVKKKKNLRLSFSPALIRADEKHCLDKSPKSDGSPLESMDLSQCFVKLISHSVEASQRPGLDAEADKLYLVTQLGGESLEELLAEHAAEGSMLSVDELRNVHWSLVSIVCGLHAAGYVHMDIKPSNIVRFDTVWKLIDFDGAVPAGTVVQRDNVCTTPCYMAPELAQMVIDNTDEIVVSRLMDVWSVGMCAMEAIFLQPVLRPWYVEWETETGDATKFMKWLGDYNAAPAIMDADMCKAMRDIDPEMCSLLQRMLVKDPAMRGDIAQCLVHNWFAPMRTQMWKGLDNGKDFLKPPTATRRRISFMGNGTGGGTQACVVM